ncbi:MAG: hypothetical protein IT169_14725 [Bryobacterales bacterium]|nr:hypothetical protein [Bryobacterales bacterium]
MTRTVLKGINGSNPLGFMASVGLLRLLDAQSSLTRLGFTEDGAFHAWIERAPTLNDLAGIVASDAKRAVGPQPWRLEYEKEEKRGIKIVADLKAPPAAFSQYLNSAIDAWLKCQPEQSEYAAAYGTDVARDGKGNTKPMAFHFTAANQQFLKAVEETRGRITKEWVEESFDDRDGKMKPGMNLRWDPGAERSRALMGANPNDDGTTANAPLEWLAFRGLPAFPSVPIGNRIVTCGVTGRRQNEFRFHWPLWSCGASYATVRSLLLLTADWIEKDEQTRRKIESYSRNGKRSRSLNRLQYDLEKAIEERRRRSVFATCTSEIRRTAQGFGNFGPAQVQT